MKDETKVWEKKKEGVSWKNVQTNREKQITTYIYTRGGGIYRTRKPTSPGKTGARTQLSQTYSFKVWLYDARVRVSSSSMRLIGRR